jgi:hypothetical protein
MFHVKQLIAGGEYVSRETKTQSTRIKVLAVLLKTHILNVISTRL